MASKSEKSAETKPKAEIKPKDSIVKALMELANTHDWNAITLPMIADKAEMSLLEIHEYFPSKGAMLASFSKMLNRKVLSATTADMHDEPMRERLLDIMMRRLDALDPYKMAIRNIKNHVKYDPLSLFALNAVALNSWRYMLAAADIDTEGHTGSLRVQGIALVFAGSLDTWLDDETEGHQKTMAMFDRKLKRGEDMMHRVSDVEKFVSPLISKLSKMFEKRELRRKPAEPDMAAEI